jgi:hypothetical protein
MRNIQFIILLFAVTALLSCYKASPIQGSASLTIVNAIPGSSGLVTNFNGIPTAKNGNQLQYFATANEINYGSSAEIGSYVGTVSLQLTTITDTSNTLWAGNLNLIQSKIYSLFLTGQDTVHVDTVLTVDSPPYHPSQDSSFSFRFVNLSFGSSLSINLQGGSYGSEANNLQYKSYTQFLNYPALSTSQNPTFEIRDAVSDSLLFSFTVRGISAGDQTNPYNRWRYGDFTIAWIGSSSVGRRIALINN